MSGFSGGYQKVNTGERFKITPGLFDNAGDNAIQMLQRVVNILKPPNGPLKIDGIMGPSTLEVVIGLNATTLYKHYKVARIQYYIDLTKEDPELKVFLAGWLNRVNSFPDIA